MSAVLRLLVVALVLFAPGAFGVIETYEFSSPELELRYRQLSAELRCPKCQNQNIADSNAPISQDLRKLLHQQLERGATDEEILDYMVARYGEFVRYRPRLGGATTVLWLAPLLLLMVALIVIAATVRRGRGNDESLPGSLNTDEQRRVEQLLEKTGKGS